MTIRQTLAQASAALAATSPTPGLDAELLMAHALGITREALLLGDPDRPEPPDFAALLGRRLAHEPIAYITGTRAFWTIDLAVGPGVLVPRADSETLIEAAMTHFRGAPPRRVLDLGTGPGTLLLAVLDQWPQATGLGVDASPEAIEYARRNAAALGMGNRATFAPGDWGAGLNERFDLILANPPYIATGEALPEEVRAHEPGEALFAGSDGLREYRSIVPQLRALLVPGGVVIIEIGSTQRDAVAALLQTEGFAVDTRRDLGGHIRALIAK